ncbi:MAG: 1-acyl-sn-glycerol-3-phosphate acyltransferase [Bacteroidetes bacterium]|nr:1-acyl-sn-glycerol-3-phosphate acyltransferase [Bacteroidota bacterium]
MKWWKPLQWLYCLYVVITFVIIMLIIFPFVVLASFMGRIRGGNMIFKLCSLWGDIWFLLIFIFTKKIYETPHDKSRPCIFVSNHISYLDAAFLVKVFRQPIRPLGKVEMAKIPVFGYIYKKAIVTVDRSSAGNRAQSIRILKSLIQKGISVLVFPEGTFNMGHTALKDFYDGAFRVAIETQTPVKPVLFLDTYSRMHYSSVFSFTPGRCRAVYMDEIPVTGLTVKDVAWLKDKTWLLMEAKLKEYKSPWIRE